MCSIAAGVASAALLLLRDVRGSVAAILVVASALTWLIERLGASQRSILGIALLGAAFALLGFPIALVVGASAVLFVAPLLARVIAVRQVGRITLERLPQPAVMPGADVFVRLFADEGFRAIGAFRFRTAGREVILTVLAGSENDRIAVVTDKVLQVASRFGTRTLLTTNSAVAPVRGDVLRQHVHGGPPEISRAHDTALRVVARYVQPPDIFPNDGDVMDAVRQMEERALAFIRDAPFRSALRIETATAAPASALGDDSHSLDRITAWLAVQS